MGEDAYLAALGQVEAGLPVHAVNLPVSDQARAALRLVFSAALNGASDAIAVAPDPAGCPNCGVRVGSSRTPYCSDCCKEEAAFVRQLRHSVSSGSIADPERQIALGQKFWRILGGGYPLRQSLVLDRTLAQVTKRTGGLCESCGAPATTVDHIGTG